MIKSLTNLEKKKGLNCLKQKNFLFCFVFVSFCFAVFLNWGIYAYLLNL